jgi:GT2 family glycosyltransferase
VELSNWIALQGQRLSLIRRAIAPSDADAREILLASLRRRWLTLKLGDDVEARANHDIDTRLYQEWIWRFDTLSQADREAIQAHIDEAALPVPLVVMRFDANAVRFAANAIERLRQQLLTNFEALLWFTPDFPPAVMGVAKQAAKDDPRIEIAPSPSDVATIAEEQDLVLFVDGGALLREHALYMFVVAASDHSPCLVYADEDWLDPDGVRRYPFFKPSYSPELERRTGYVGSCILLRGIDVDWRALLGGEGGGRAVGRVTALATGLGREGVRSVPFVLYHIPERRRPRQHSFGEVELSEEKLPSVSIIIPTRDGREMLEPCLASIAKVTNYPHDKIEIVIIDNGSTDPSTLRYLHDSAASGVIKLLRDPGAFNYSRLNNLGAREAKGEVLIFLNNDTLVDDPDWLRCLVGQAMQHDVGAVGAKLLYPDRTVQFGGTIVGFGGIAGHAHVGLPEDDGGYCGLAGVTHEVGAVTGACLAIRRALFEELGGLDTALAVACNDVLLCVEALQRGYRNVYVARPLLIHLESKTRGLDDTDAKRELHLEEGRYLRSRHRQVFRNDPYYSPNLSYQRPYHIAAPPRRDKPWRAAARKRGKLRILLLSLVHGRGHGVPVVLQQQAAHLVRLGHEVFVGGPQVHRGIGYPGCRLVELNDPGEAAAYAVAKDIDCIVAHTAPFFSVVRLLGDFPRCILYDHGEPDPAFFADAAARRGQLVERQFCLAIADRVIAISDPVRRDIARDDVAIVRNGNSHLAGWSKELVPTRERTRAARHWTDKAVVLNVCRFERAERRYKGVDVFADIARRFRETYPELASRVVFVLCGKASPADVTEVEATGLTAVANVSDQELIDLYAAADVYMSFSQWEGYNLGIGQALALGLPVIASDIPAHREFDIPVTNDASEVATQLEPLTRRALSGALLAERRPKLSTWDEPLAAFAKAVEEVCRP